MAGIVSLRSFTAALTTTFRHIIQAIFVYVIITTGSFLMLKMIAEHTGFDSHAGFLQLKQAYVHQPVWRTAFYIHVFSAVVALMAGFTQFSPLVLRQHRGLHRLAGRLYVWIILVINVPAGFILAINANGGISSRIAFLLLDFLWFYFTWKGFRAIRVGDVSRHRRFMLRSYALTFSAVTLRSWKFLLSRVTNIDLPTLYMIDAWLGFIPNLLFIEWWISRNWPYRNFSARKIKRGRNKQQQAADHNGKQPYEEQRAV